MDPDSGARGYNVEVMQERFQQLVLNKVSDVNFVFMEGPNIVEVPAIKELLCRSSPVFNAMFTGGLSEKSAVKIEDASPSVFREFLRVFYGGPLKLSLQNIGDILCLADKYDVGICRRICVDFLMRNLQIDNILWGLHLAVIYQLDNLREFCELEIQKNIKIVLSMFDFSNPNKTTLISNRSNAAIFSEIDLTYIFPRVLAISSNTITKMDNFCRLNVYSFRLTSSKRDIDSNAIVEPESFGFYINVPVILTDIYCSRIYVQQNDKYVNAAAQCNIFITKFLRNNKQGTYECVFSTKHTITNGRNHIKLAKPIELNPNYLYDITTACPNNNGLFTWKVDVPDKPFQIGKNLYITFSKQLKHSLISSLNFERKLEL